MMITEEDILVDMTVVVEDIQGVVIVEVDIQDTQEGAIQEDVIVVVEEEDIQGVVIVEVVVEAVMVEDAKQGVQFKL